jgi:hypothetical protein
VAVLKFNPEMRTLFLRELMNDHVVKIETHAKQFDEKKHIELLKALMTAYGQMRYSQFPIIPLEVAIIESLK